MMSGRVGVAPGTSTIHFEGAGAPASGGLGLIFPGERPGRTGSVWPYGTGSWDSIRWTPEGLMWTDGGIAGAGFGLVVDPATGLVDPYADAMDAASAAAKATADAATKAAAAAKKATFGWTPVMFGVGGLVAGYILGKII